MEQDIFNCTKYDNELNKIHHFMLHPELLPYVGSQYEEFKILLIGESHYLPKDNINATEPMYNRKNVWEYCKQNNCFAMQYEYNKQDSSSVTRNINVAKEVKVGDYAIAYTGDQRIIAVGKVTREFYEEKDESKYTYDKEGWAQRIGVVWENIIDKPLYVKEFNKTLGLLEPNKLSTQAIHKISYDGYCKAVEMLNNADDIDNTGNEKTISTYTKQNLLKEVFINEEKYDGIIFDLVNKKNIILQGPPGVGKTFVAKRMGVQGTEKMTQAEYRKAAIDAVKKLAADVGIPAKISEVGVKDKDIDFLAASAMADACAPGNPKCPTKEEIIKLYQSMM